MKSITLILIPLFWMISQSIAQVSAGGEPLSASLALKHGVPTVEMPAVDVQSFLAEDEADGWDVPLRFGAPHDVSLNLGNSGAWEDVPGGKLWRLRVYSAGAHSLNFQFDRFRLPASATLFLYNDDRSFVLGAFTKDNNKPDGRFGTQPQPGDAVTLEYFEPLEVCGEGEISIWRVVHAYRGFFAARGNLDEFGDAASCAVNINCPEAADWQDEKRGVAMIITGDGVRLCSGTLINNTAFDGLPLYHTAQHCADWGGLGSWVFVFNYESPQCSPNEDGPTDQSASGAEMRFQHFDTDVALLEILEPIPLEYNPYFNGWSALDVAPTSSACISHPAVDVKKIGIDNDAALSSTYAGCPPNSHWRVVHWEVGHAEHGSSGSPLFDQNGLIVGQCHGGDGWCDEVVNHNVEYGKLSMSFELGASEVLDPLGTGATSIEGYDPNYTGSVAGVITDAETNLPFAGVTVTLDGTDYTAQSGADGAYSLEDVRGGIYTVRSAIAGYNEAVVTGVEVEQEVTVTLDFALLHPELELSVDSLIVTIPPDAPEVSFEIFNGGNGPLDYSIRMLRTHDGVTLEPWTSLADIPVSEEVGNFLIQGCEFAGNHWYVSGGRGTVGGDNRLYRFDLNGEYVDWVAQPANNSLFGIYDLATDGNLLYGSQSDTAGVILAFDLEGNLQGTIPSPLNPARAIAYDPATDHFWVGDLGQNILEIDRAGTVHSQIVNESPGELNVFGLAWNAADHDGCFLYVFNQSYAPNETRLCKIDPVSHTVHSLPVLAGQVGDRAGGAALTTGWDNSLIVLGAVMQNVSGDRLDLYLVDVGDAWILVDPVISSVPAGSSGDVSVVFNANFLRNAVYEISLMVYSPVLDQERDLPLRLTVDLPDAAAPELPVELPAEYELAQNYPNPFNSSTTIEYGLKLAGHTSLIVYDVLGRQVAELVHSTQTAGRHRLVFDSSDLSSGVYFYRLTSGNFTRSGKMVLLK